MSTRTLQKPPWLRVRLPEGDAYRAVRRAVSQGDLHTVCEEAHCPNQGECWGAGTATFLILGDTCTRGCRFCAVPRGDPAGATDPTEPARVARAAAEMGLSYAVVTSVTRDDLPDGGSALFAETVRSLKALSPRPLVELLIPDLLGAPLEAVLRSEPDVVAHNVEVVERLTPALRHRRFDYHRSLEVLEGAGAHRPRPITKSSLLLGLGETDREVEGALADLRRAGVAILVLGQYLQPSRAHAPVHEYVAPERFERWAHRGREMGFDFVASGPLVRTSYRAAEACARSRKDPDD